MLWNPFPDGINIETYKKWNNTKNWENQRLLEVSSLEIKKVFHSVFIVHVIHFCLHSHTLLLVLCFVLLLSLFLPLHWSTEADTFFSLSLVLPEGTSSYRGVFPLHHHKVNLQLPLGHAVNDNIKYNWNLKYWVQQLQHPFSHSYIQYCKCSIYVTSWLKTSEILFRSKS